MPTLALSQCMRLTELATARLCHEIGGSIGAVATALDVMKEQTAERSEASALANDAAAEAIARLRLFRTAWGTQPGDMSLAEIASLSGGLPASGRVSIDWSGLPANTVFPAPAGRIVLNLLMLACESIPDRGSVALTGSADDLFIRLVSPRAAWPVGFALALADVQAAMAALSEPQNIQMPLTVMLARESDVVLTLPMATGSGGKSGGAAPLRMESKRGREKSRRS